VAHPEDAAEIARAGKKKVLNSHLYLDRVSTIFQQLGLVTEADHVLEVKQSWLAEQK